MGPFRVVELVGDLAYRLDLPQHFRMHPVISVTHLEPARSDSKDASETKAAEDHDNDTRDKAVACDEAVTREGLSPSNHDTDSEADMVEEKRTRSGATYDKRHLG